MRFLYQFIKYYRHLYFTENEFQIFLNYSHLSVCLRMEQLGSHCTDFDET